MFDEAKQLRIPGPSPVPPSVQRAISRTMIGHRSGDFTKVMKRVHEGLQQIFQTESEIAILAGSGTAAMEAAVANLVSPGDSALVLVGGKFGERWQELVEAFGGRAVVLEYPYGEGADPQQVAEKLAAHPEISLVFATQNESSTAVLNDIEGLTKVAHEHGAMIVVDAVSGLGGAPLPMDEWGVDVVVSGSQKCLMLPPGLSFVAAQEAAWKRMESVQSHRYYFNLPAYRKGVAKGQTPYTPAVSLIFGLEEALRLILEEGLENTFARHRLLRDMVRAGIRALGLPLYVDEKWASPTLTAVGIIDSFDVEAFRKIVSQECGVVLAGGQAELSGRIFRIGHMGYATPLDMLTTLAAIEVGLMRAGQPIEGGAGVRAAQEVWIQWRSES